MLVDSESGLYVRVERHVYLRTVDSVSYHYKNPTKRVGLIIIISSRSPRHSCKIDHRALKTHTHSIQVWIQLDSISCSFTFISCLFNCISPSTLLTSSWNNIMTFVLNLFQNDSPFNMHYITIKLPIVITVLTTN